MESTGTYQAGSTTADDDATPEKVVPLRRGFYMTDNAYVDELMYDLSGAAWKVLTFIIRQTCGYHVPQAAISLATFREGIKRPDGTVVTRGTGLSSPAIIEALDDLQRAHIITRTDDGRRTTVPSYALRPHEEWTLDALHAPKTRRTCKKILQADDASKKTLQASPETSQKILQVGPSSLSENLTHKIQGRDKYNQRKEKQTDANASGRGVDTPASDTPATPSSSESSPEKPARKPRKERELSPDHQYRVTLLAAIDEARGGKSPNHDAEWSAAGKFYRWNNGQPAAVDDIAACYALELQRPKWDSDTPLLNVLLRTYGAYVKNRANFRAGIERARAAADGKYDAPRQNGRATVPDIPSTIPRLSD